MTYNPKVDKNLIYNGGCNPIIKQKFIKSGI